MIDLVYTMLRKHSSYQSRLTVGLGVIFLVAVMGTHDTWAIYTSGTVSGKNVLRGGSIELSVSTDFSDDGARATLAPDSKYSYLVTVKNEGRNSLGYQAKFVTDGEAGLCERLHLTAKRADEVVYTGRLVDFNSISEDPLGSDGTDVWRFSVGISEPVAEVDRPVTCVFRYHIDAWQDRLLTLGMGWHDAGESEPVTLSIQPRQDSTSDVEELAIPDPLVPDVSIIDDVAPDNTPVIPVDTPSTDPNEEALHKVVNAEEGIVEKTEEVQ